jgi:hypothetical protein
MTRSDIDQLSHSCVIGRIADFLRLLNRLHQCQPSHALLLTLQRVVWKRGGVQRGLSMELCHRLWLAEVG